MLKAYLIVMSYAYEKLHGPMPLSNNAFGIVYHNDNSSRACLPEAKVK